MDKLAVKMLQCPEIEKLRVCSQQDAVTEYIYIDQPSKMLLRERETERTVEPALIFLCVSKRKK